MELCAPLLTPTQLCHGISLSCKVAFILLKMTSAVPHLGPLVVHIPRKRWATLLVSKIWTVMGFIFSLPAMTAFNIVNLANKGYMVEKTWFLMSVKEKNIIFNISLWEIPASLEPSVMRVCGPSLICTTNSFLKWGANASFTIHAVLVVAHL